LVDDAFRNLRQGRVGFLFFLQRCVEKPYGSGLRAVRFESGSDLQEGSALRVLKKKMQREGVFREMKRRKAYEKPSERKTREKARFVPCGD